MHNGGGFFYTGLNGLYARGNHHVQCNQTMVQAIPLRSMWPEALQPQRYKNDRGEPVLVCRKCTEYAERRAFVRR
ncbi:hypothetical protein R3398_18590 [Rossellomorea marisflavi]|uniref:hypothetical protein n=1 Tax=Rossellomorea marisflavi TaxID=189381 RepID=UPI00296FBD20|nr:hypothetical protein [Rossellomorea marisflavi]MDW4528352.1 hypothetical protein [Rossellomorea marisflavi]